MLNNKNLSGIITWIAAMAVGTIRTLFPAGYFLPSRQNTMERFGTEAEINAKIITQIIYEDPKDRCFEHVRPKAAQ